MQNKNLGENWKNVGDNQNYLPRFFNFLPVFSDKSPRFLLSIPENRYLTWDRKHRQTLSSLVFFCGDRHFVRIFHFANDEDAMQTTNAINLA